MANPDHLPPRLRKELQTLERLPDGAIDTTDSPEVTDWSGARRGALYRPEKRQVTIRLDADILEWFQAGEKRGYQTRINAALRTYMSRHDRP